MTGPEILPLRFVSSQRLTSGRVDPITDLPTLEPVRRALLRGPAAPALVTLLLGVAFLIWDPRPGDLAGHAFRADLFGREGFTVFSLHWYGGHHTPAYSLLAPPLGWLLGPSVVLVAACVAVSALFECLVRGRFGARASRVGALWLAVGAGTLMGTGRMPFALGAALGLGCLLALQRSRPGWAYSLAALCPLASPVAGLFLGMAGLAHALAGGESAARRRGAAVAVAAVAPAAMLSLAFPEGGYAPFPVSSYVAIPAFAAACLALLQGQRTLRIGAALYALGATLAVLLPTPMGGNAPRLGMLFGGPLLACAVAARPRPARVAWAPLALAALALGYWQWTSAARDLDKAVRDPAAKTAYFDSLREYLATLPDQRRIEIPFTSSRWESAEIAPTTPLARGWLRQLDTGLDPVFYSGRLTALTYGAWLSENGVRYVALPDVKPDKSSYRERALIENGLPYLRLRWRSRHWRLYEVLLPAPMVIPSKSSAIDLEQLGSDRVLLRVRRPGAAVVRVRWTPYWLAKGGCVEPAGGWTRVTSARRGFVELVVRFSPERVIQRGRRCNGA